MIKTVLFAVLTLLLGASGVWYALTSNFNFGNLAVWLMALACLVYTLFHRQIDAFALSGVGFIVKVLFFAGCALFLAVLCVILYGQWGSTPSGEEEIVIVLGCAVHGEEPSAVLVERLDTALAYYQAHPTVTLVVTGGQGAEEIIPEAVVMQRYLIAHGVPEAQVLVETQSSSTEENFRFSKILLEENGFVITTQTPIVYITNGFHCMRAGLYAQNEGFENATALAAGLPPMQYLPCYLREVFAVVYYAVFKSPSAGFLRNLVGVLHLGGK